MNTPPRPVRCLIKLELNLDERGNVFYNTSVQLEVYDKEDNRSDKTIYAKPDLARDQYYNRLQERLNNMLQVALNEMQREGQARFSQAQSQ